MKVFSALLSQRGLHLLSLQSIEPKNPIYPAVYPAHNCPCLVIVTQGPNSTEDNIKLAETVRNLQHPHILCLYDCLLFQTGCLVQVVENYHCNLMQEVNRRQLTCEPWTEFELWHHVRSLISAFHYISTQAFKKQVISPYSFFLTPDRSNLKVACYQTSSSDSQMVETYFLC